MPRLIIDNIEVEVPAETKVIEAARKAGIIIPHFCYHPALGSVGACRLCAVKMLDGPVKGIQMSCMLPVQDGMVVSTTDEEAAMMRRLVIEWLMINHPHDCPVCDEGGECLLQDYTVAGGHAIRRYKGKKRTYHNQYLGSTIEHEMNRCIQCYRCSRFYQEYSGGNDLGPLGRANVIYFGRKEEGPLESPFSGNLVDICPTGVYTDKTARFRARYWDYDMGPSVCPHCSLGCNTIPAARYRELLKTMARRNDLINGWFICDRGRFNNHPVNDPHRPRYPLIRGARVAWNDAMETLAGNIREMLDSHGDGSVVLVGSSRMSQEGNAMLAHLAAGIGAGISFFTDSRLAENTLAAVSILNSENVISMGAVEKADCVVLTCTDVMEEGAMTALAVRQAWRRGAKVFLVASSTSQSPDRLPFSFTMLESMDKVPFGEFSNPVIVCGTAACETGAMQKLASMPADLFFLFDGPNSFGAALLAAETGAPSLSQAVSGGKVKGIVAFETDIPSEFLQGARLLGVADWMATETASGAEVFIPITAHVEMDGTYINNEGRAQRFVKIMDPGLPIRGLDPDRLHPPRAYRHEPPGAEPRPSWVVVAELIERLGGGKSEPLSGRWEFLRDLDPEGEGIRVI